MFVQGVDYGTPYRERSGTSEKKGSPLKLDELCEVEVSVYDVRGKGIDHVRAFLESEEGGKVEWYEDKLFVKVEGYEKDVAAAWIVSWYQVLMYGSGWKFGRTTHVPGPDRAFIPDGIARYAPHRIWTPAQTIHAMALKPLPNWVLEAEWENLVDEFGKGYDKIIHGLFPMIGPDNSRIEEAWVLVFPAVLPAVPEQVVALPLELQAAVQPVHERPPAGTRYLAILRRVNPLPPNPADPVLEYYILEPNTRFVVPDYSVFSAHGPAGGHGAPALSVNILLSEMAAIEIVQDAPLLEEQPQQA